MAGCCGGSLGAPLGLSYHTPYGPLGDAPPAGVNLPPNMARVPTESDAAPAGGTVPPATETAATPRSSAVSGGVLFLLVGGAYAAYRAFSKRG